MRHIQNTFSSIFIALCTLTLAWGQQEVFPLETIIQRGHEKPIDAAAFSPDGAYALTGSKDNSIKLWDLNSGFELRTFHWHTDYIRDVRFSHHGKWILSTGADDRVIVQEVMTGLKLFDFSLKDRSLRRSVFTADDRFVISTDNKGHLLVWDLSTSNAVNHFKKSYTVNLEEAYTGSKTSLIATLTGNETLDLVRLATQDTVWTRQLGEVHTYAIRPDEKEMAVGSSELVTWIVDTESGELKHTLISDQEHKCRGCNTRVAYSHDGKLLLSGANKNGLTLWKTSNYKKINTLKPQKDGIKFISFSADDQFFMVQTQQEVTVYETKTCQKVYSYRSETLDDLEVRFSPAKNQILIPTLNHTLTLVDVPSGKHQKVLKGYLNEDKKDGMNMSYNNWVQGALLQYVSMKTGVAVSPNSKWIVKGNVDSTVFVIDLKTGSQIKKLKGHQKMVYRMAFSPDGKVLATAGADRYIILWDTQTWTEIGRLQGHVNVVFDLAFNSSGTKLVSSAWDGYLLTWDLKTQKILHWESLEGTSVYTAAFLPKDYYLLTGDLSQKVLLREEDTQQQYGQLVGHSSLLSGVDFDKQNNKMYTSSWDGTVKEWSIGSQMITDKHTQHQAPVYCVEFLPLRHWVVSGGADNQLVVWDTRSHSIVKKLSGHHAAVTEVAVGLQEQYMVSTSADGEVKVWDLETLTELYSYLQINQQDWLVTNTYGYFDGSAGALKLVTYVKGLKAVPITSLFEKYYTPSLSKRILEGEEFTSLDEEINQDLKAVPVLKTYFSGEANYLVDTDTGMVSKSDYVALEYDLVSPDPGTHTIRVFKNQKVVQNVLTSSKTRSSERKLTVHLDHGLNTIQTVALNAQNIESEQTTLEVYFDGEKGKTDLYLVAIGVNDYKNPSYHLNYALQDAQAFAKNIVKGTDSLFNQTHVRVVKNANRKDVTTALDQVKTEIGPEDVFIFFYAGHGAMDQQADSSQFYLVLRDVVSMYGAQQLQENGFSAQDLSEVSRQIAAEKQLYVIDACHSGGMLQTMASRGQQREKALAQLARSTGTFFLTASQDVQYANESNELKHGVFTYSLLEVLGGKDTTLSRDTKITVSELKTYVEERVPELSRLYKGYTQYPTSYGYGQDFPVVIVR